MDRQAPRCHALDAAPASSWQRLRAALSRRGCQALFIGSLTLVTVSMAEAIGALASEATSASAPDASTKFLYLHSPPSRWQRVPTFYYNHDGAPAGIHSASIVGIIESAVAQWGVSCGLDITFGGLTTARVDTNAGDYDNMGRDGVNVIGWMVTDDPFYTAEAGVFLGTMAGSSSTIVEADVRLFANSYGDWRAAPLNYLMLHELGHALGIGHSDVPDVVMSGPPATSYNQLTSLARDDTRACQALYVFEAVEYYNPQYGHYFATAAPEEVLQLEQGTIAGWVRTGHSFPVMPSGATGATKTCRFWSAQRFAPKSSHFYATSPVECEVVRRNQDWLFEGEVFSLWLPDASGRCGSGTRELYRSYNGGKGGTPNHRYTTDIWIQSEMIDHGWVPEGYGPWGVVACVPTD